MKIREVEGIRGDMVVVEVTREIKVGKVYKIQPTEAYLGIDQGTVVVTNIDALEYLEGDTLEQAREFCRIHLDGMTGQDYYDEDMRLNNQPWVAYQYSRLPGDQYVLPLEEFVIHSTMY